MEIVRMKVEYMDCPIGIDTEKPAFGWNVETDEEDWRQEAYRLWVADSEALLAEERGNLWDSGRVDSDSMVNIIYNGKMLESAKRYYWKVRVWQNGQSTDSKVCFFEMGFMEQECWKGCWLGETAEGEHHIYRRLFRLSSGIASARAYICGLGHYELTINGKQVTDAVLQPGWTNYDKSCLYNVYDITALLREGANALGVLLGNGMYHIPEHKGRYAYFPRSYGYSRFLLQLEITYEDGTKQTVVSDGQFSRAKSPAAFSCIYGGEEYYAEDAQAGFDTAEFEEDEGWSRAVQVEPPRGRLAAQKSRPLKVMEMMKPVSVRETKPGVYLYDLGRNFSGWVRIHIRTNGCLAGECIRMKPGEILKTDGTPDQRVTGRNYSWDYYMDSREHQEYAPRFTYTGFRYVQVEGAVPAELADGSGDKPVLESLIGEFIYPDMERTGSFHCSYELYNQIHDLITQAMLSNIKSIFTDCPHREKLGWLEQTHLIGPAILYNFDVHNLYEKTEQDMAESQHEDGLVPDICPEYITEFVRWHYGYLDSPEWGSACIINPWYIYKKYGDTAVFTRYYDTMKRYMDYLTSKTHHCVLHHGLGDWLDIGPYVPYSQNTPVPVIATAVYYYDLGIMKQVAELLGREEDQKAYEDQMREVKREYNLQFFDDQAFRYGTGSQAAQAVSLMAGLVEEEYEQKVLEVLVRDIQLRGFATTAGDVGHPFVTAALTKYGRSDVMNEMMKVKDKPGYGYQVECGATTLTEEWDGPMPERPHGSQNHFMLGSGDEWFYSGLSGIQGMRRGRPFDELLIQPYIAEQVDEVDTWHIHPYGKVAVHWKKEGENHVVIQIVLPPNTKGTFIAPDGSESTIGSGRHEFLCEWKNIHKAG